MSFILRSAKNHYLNFFIVQIVYFDCQKSWWGGGRWRVQWECYSRLWGKEEEGRSCGWADPRRAGGRRLHNRETGVFDGRLGERLSVLDIRLLKWLNLEIKSSGESRK